MFTSKKKNYMFPCNGNSKTKNQSKHFKMQCMFISYFQIKTLQRWAFSKSKVKLSSVKEKGGGGRRREKKKEKKPPKTYYCRGITGIRACCESPSAAESSGKLKNLSKGSNKKFKMSSTLEFFALLKQSWSWKKILRSLQKGFAEQVPDKVQNPLVLSNTTNNTRATFDYLLYFLLPCCQLTSSLHVYFEDILFHFLSPKFGMAVATSLNQALHFKWPEDKVHDFTGNCNLQWAICIHTDVFSTENNCEAKFILLIFSWDTSYLPDVSVIITNHLCFALSLSHSCCTGLFVNVQEQSPLSFVD